LLLTVIVAGCGREPAPARALDVTPGTVCALDGMLLSDYPGPKAQIHYEEGPPEFFCDTIEMFAMMLQPETQRRIRGAFTQDMGQDDQLQRPDRWIDARSAFYVEGSDFRGAMGPTLAAFARREDAQRFVGRHGGRVMAFGAITPEMVDLSGGAQRDDRM
jgi:copper chaperone NosL